MTAHQAHLRAQRVFYAVVVLVSVAAAYVVHAAIPPNALTLPGEKRLRVNAIVPEGWAFFTKTPRTPEVLVFQRRADMTWRDVHAARLSEAGWLNLSRNARAQGVEIGLLLHGVPNDAWVACDEAVQGCLAGAPLSRTVRNVVAKPTVCGDVVFAQRKRVPWSFRRSTTPDDMPSIVVRLDVSCP